jgi:hypothetical protein
MIAETTRLDLKAEAEALAVELSQGNPCASMHLARLIEVDTRGAFYPFAEALAARLRNHLERWAELGVTDPEITLAEEVYHLLKLAAIDWDGLPCNGRPGEEA